MPPIMHAMEMTVLGMVMIMMMIFRAMMPIPLEKTSVVESEVFFGDAILVLVKKLEMLFLQKKFGLFLSLIRLMQCPDEVQRLCIK
jgi:hypothetical protein